MNHFQRYLSDEFAEDYQKGRLSRRDALKLIASVTGNLILANSILAACAPPPEATQIAGATQDASPTGPPPPVDEVPNIQAPVLAIYGELDGRITGTIPAIEQAMQANHKVYEKLIYPNADHAFNNDSGSRYNAEAARDAWNQTLAWFEKYL